MSYIQNNLQAGEEIKYKADIHWYIFAYQQIWLYHQSYKVQKRNQCADSINEKHLKNTKGADIKAFIHKTVMELLC